jgi:hypothetical protein
MSLTDRILDHVYPIRFSKREREDILDSPEKCLVPADEQPRAAWPVGFFKALTRSGLDGGLGFCCDGPCKLLIQCGLEPGITFKHCGRVVVTPQPNERMETHRVGYYKS